jgi:hypothetical protein
MFDLFHVVADRVREQAAEYARAQARIGLRTFAHTVDPFGVTSAMLGASAPGAPPAGADLEPPKARNGRRVPRAVRPAGRRSRRRGRPHAPRPALNFA